MHDGLSGIGVLHRQQIKRCVIEGNRRLEDESIDTRAGGDESAVLAMRNGGRAHICAGEWMSGCLTGTRIEEVWVRTY
jgi:hypothetical protein